MSPLYKYNGKLLSKNGKLATSAACCCEECWSTTVTFIGGSDGILRNCDPIVKEQIIINIPDEVCIPALAEVSWIADDDIAINNVRLNATWNDRLPCELGDACCASNGTRRICIDQRVVVLDLIDTVGINWGGTCTIKICPSDCGCDQPA